MGALLSFLDAKWINYKDLRLAPQTKWTFWEGGKCPVPEGVMVKVRWRDGDTSGSWEPNVFNWSHSGDAEDIIAYRILGLAEGYTDNTEGDSMKLTIDTDTLSVTKDGVTRKLDIEDSRDRALLFGAGMDFEGTYLGNTGTFWFTLNSARMLFKVDWKYRLKPTEGHTSTPCDTVQHQ